MNFRNWSDVDNFPGVRECTSSHAFVEEFGQPFWHNATSYFLKFGWNVIGRAVRFRFRVFDEKLVTISALWKEDQISADANSKFSVYKDQMPESWWSHYLKSCLTISHCWSLMPVGICDNKVCPVCPPFVTAVGNMRF